MSDFEVTGASSIDVVEAGDGRLVLRERPRFSFLSGLAFLVAGAGLLWFTVGVRGPMLVELAQEFAGELGLGLAALGLGVALFDFGWTELRVTPAGVELSRRVLFFRLREKLPFPVDISAPAKGIEVTHRFGRYRFAARLNSVDSTRLVNYLLAKFPVLERMDAA
jgi:hypothetical protein